MYSFGLALCLIFSSHTHRPAVKPVHPERNLYARVDAWGDVHIGLNRDTIDREVDRPWFYVTKD